MMKNKELLRRCLEQGRDRGHTRCVIADGLEDSVAAVCAALSQTPSGEARGVVSWQARSWESLAELGAYVTLAMLGQMGLDDRYEGQVLVDLRYCEGQPTPSALLHLTGFLEPLGGGCAALLLVRQESVPAIQRSLCALEPHRFHEKAAERTAFHPRMIGFERGESYELS